MSSDKIIFAFDISAESDTDPAYIKRTEMFSDMLDYVGIVKIGMEAFYSTNGEILEWFESEKVFLDLKLHDIPETVGRATRTLCEKYRPKFLSVHLAEPNSFKRACDEAVKFGTKILGITVLTSMTESNCYDIFGKSPQEQVENLVTFPDEHEGFGGFVCSGHEVKMIRFYWPDATIVVPGVRSKGVGKNDQRRVVTPGEAIKFGANYVVIGREIRDADNPLAEATRIAQDIEKATASTGENSDT